LKRFLVVLALLALAPALRAEETPGHDSLGHDSIGYYRYPAIHGDTLVFAAEGDLWRVDRRGGVASRLTTHPAEESNPAISPDGRTLAFSAAYEGPTEVYTMPIDGGLPVRRTFEGAERGGALVAGWTPGGEILYATTTASGLPSTQLARLDPATGRRALIPLAQASEGCYDGETLFFTRFAFQGSHTKRYRGGTAQSLWRFDGHTEAAPLTADFAGTSRSPMVWQGRVYFVSDRDGTMNLWSMDEKGGTLSQHTFHRGWDVTSPDLSEGRIVYQLGADLRLFDVAANQDAPLPIRLVSDFDQMRETWVKKPMDFLTASRLSPIGDRLVLTARGQVFVVPVKEGRIVEVTRKPGVRYREARFLPDGKSVFALSDETGEVELWKFPANGVGKPEPLTSEGKVLRWEGEASPDGRWIAHHDKDQQLWLLDLKTRKQQRLATSTSPYGGFQNLSWSPDSRWLAWSVAGSNSFTRIYLYQAATGKTVPLTSDRFNSTSPAWSRDGKWLYFLSDRSLRTLVRSPWGARQPDPYLTATTGIFGVALKKDTRSPFQPPDELHPAKNKDNKDDDDAEPASGKKADKDDKDKDKDKDQGKKPPKVEIDLEGLAGRLYEVPVPPGNYESLTAGADRLYWLSVQPRVEDDMTSLETVPFDPEKTDPKTVLADIEEYDLSADGKKLMIRKEEDFYVLDAEDATGEEELAEKDLAKAKVDLAGWTFPFNPREQWQQMFREAWRLERDYFYDPKMHGVDWPAMLEKYRPLSLRVTSRSELDDLLGQMVSELSALHTFVRSEQRKGDEEIEVASLGAALSRDEAAGGWRVEHLYRTDSDLPSTAGPLQARGVRVGEGDVIESINGTPTLSVMDLGALLRNQAGKQALLRVKDAKTKKSRDVVVMPVSPEDGADLRYGDWETSRRLAVEEKGKSEIGYVHLRAMSGEDYTSWARDFYPVFDRPGLIVDVRNNRGGNIESWILAKLLRKAWFWWQPRQGEPYPNMPYAFRGHLVVLVNESTASDGEAFAEGIRRLKLGRVIGTRTWGGEIWLTASNVLVDKGVATAAEFGVYGPEGSWMIEGHGVDPDEVVDNLPRATFDGRDAQLDAAIRYLQEKIKAEPVPVPKAPAYPDKSLVYPKEK
jgi:tricorn protease